MKAFLLVPESLRRLAFSEGTVPAGFPSPAEDYMQSKIDLNEQLVKRPASTFIVRVEGNSMIDAKVHDGDLVVVDRSLTASGGDMIIAFLNGAFTLKTFKRKGKAVWLYPENVDYKPVKVTSRDDFKIWGVVTNIIHKVK